MILMGFAKNGSMTSVDEPSSKLHGWASPSHRLRPGRLLVYEHLGGGDVFNRLQKCTCDNAGSSVYSLFEQDLERRFEIQLILKSTVDFDNFIKVPFTWKQRISVAYDASCGPAGTLGVCLLFFSNKCLSKLDSMTAAGEVNQPLNL